MAGMGSVWGPAKQPETPMAGGVIYICVIEMRAILERVLPAYFGVNANDDKSENALRICDILLLSMYDQSLVPFIYPGILIMRMKLSHFNIRLYNLNLTGKDRIFLGTSRV